MITNQQLQKLLRRVETGLRMGSLIHTALFLGLIYSFAHRASVANAVLVVVCVIWIAMSIQARRKALLSTTASQMIAAGQFQQASETLLGICRGFCLQKPVALMACHNLAVIFQKQHRWPEVWRLCELVRSWAGKGLSEIRILSESLRADCGLALNNLSVTYESLSFLSRMPLSVTERLSVLPAEVNYCIRVGQSDALMLDLPNKVLLAGLLPAEQAAIVHASLALAAHRAHQVARRDWLWRRASLYCPAEELLAAQSIFRPIAEAVSTADKRACGDLQQKI